MIPQYISKYAQYSACFCVFPNCIITYMYDYKIMSALFGLLYVTTMLYWYKVQDGIIKKIDMGVATLSIYRLTCVERHRLLPIYQTYWLYIVGIMSIVFIVNEYIFFMQIKCPCKTPRWISILNYTWPDTKEREMACYKSVGRHICFIHVLPTITFGSFIVLSAIP